MYPSLLDDEDWKALEAQRMESDSLGGLLEPLGSGLPPSAAAYSAGGQMAPLQLDTGPDWSDALGAGVTGLAGIADLALNKGRGFGQIMSGAGAYGAARANQRVQQQEAAMRYEAQRAAQAAVQGRQAGLDDIARGNLAARNAELAEMRARRLKEGAGLNDLQKAQANLYESQAYKNYTQGGDVDPETAARLQQQREIHDEDLADRRAARDQNNEMKRTIADSTAETKRDRESRQAEKDYQAEANKFRDETEKTRPQLTRMKQIDDILNKPQYADDIPGIGAGSYVPGWVPDAMRGGKEAATDARTVQSAMADMADLLGRQRSGAAIPPAEYAKMQEFITAGTHATDEQFRDAYAAYHKALSTEFMQQTAGRENVARDVMRADGGNMVDYMNFGETKPTGPLTAAGDDLPDNLGVTGPRGVRNTPDFPGGARRAGNGVKQAAGQQPLSSGSVNSGGMVPVVSPSGKRGMVTPEQADQLRDLPGWQVP